MAENQDNRFLNSEIVIGLVGAIGTRLEAVSDYISTCLRNYRYNTETIVVSRDVLNDLSVVVDGYSDNMPPFEKISKQMDIGNIMRNHYQGLVGIGIVAQITQRRSKLMDNKFSDDKDIPVRIAFVVKSLKNADEVRTLRSVYGNGFYLIGVYEDEETRRYNLIHNKSISEEQASKLMERDRAESEKYGQQSLDTYQMSDFFLDLGATHWMSTVDRIFDLIFGNPFITPTFDEFAMFMAYASSLRSSDLSRQVGAVVTRDHDILSLGTNDSPKSKGGQNWADKDDKIGTTPTRGTDAFRGYDANKAEFDNIADEVMNVFGIKESEREEYRSRLKHTGLGGLTEYGRSVHAEMEALGTCARNGIPTKGCTMYVTTFPCHNCAKHIVDMGIEEVYYIEPYPKSKALKLHDDSISTDPQAEGKVRFLPFTGVGPRRYMELFAMVYPPLYDKKRKGNDGKVVKWSPQTANVRSQMVPMTYLEHEKKYLDVYDLKVYELKKKQSDISKQKTKKRKKKKVNG